MKKVICLFASAVLSLSIFAQSLSTTQAQDISANLNYVDNNVGSTVEKFPDPQLAMSVPNYPVTCGDVYTLAFVAGSSPVTYSIPVDTTYKIRVANLGVINAAGLTYQQLKQQVEALVQRNYPMGGVQFVLTNPATFLVTIKGEVRATTEKNAWALSRLSAFANSSFTAYSSSRNVQIVSTNGTTKTYDLFKASREGDLSQDPYLRPGDTIVVNRLSRKVTVSGAVERPGTYELLEGENLKQLIDYYGNGLTDFANTDRIQLVRILGSESKSGNTLYISNKEISENYELKNGDSISISSNTSYLPKILVEGIIRNPNAGQDSADTAKQDDTPSNTSYRQYYTFYEGENYSNFVRRISGIFNSYSDLQNAYFERENQKYYLNIETILYDTGFVSEYKLMPDDKLVIPFQQHFQTVLINGEVNSVREESAWPLRRLSTIIGDNLTEFSSTRDIIVTSLEGNQTVYDLFKANRFGDMSQNPYIRAGETITIQRLERKVSISGAVERPGTYELLEGENLKQLIEYYGNGLVALADTSRIELSRVIDANDVAGSKYYLNQESIDSDYELKNRDSISIGSFSSLQPVVFVEGAIYSSAEGGSANPSSANKVSLNFTADENYAFFVRNHSTMFRGESDIANAYIIRGEEIIPLDISVLLYDKSAYSDQIVKNGDRLMIPFKQFFVTVSGAVKLPGRYPYIPDRAAEYYINLAGGFDKDKNVGNLYSVEDMHGNKLKMDDPILPECMIDVKNNSFMYQFTRIAPVVTSFLSIVTTTLTTLVYIKSLSQ